MRYNSRSICSTILERAKVDERSGIREYARMLVRITDLAQAFGTARDLQTIYSALREFTVASVPSIGIFISLYDPQREVRTAAYGWGDGLDAAPADADHEGRPQQPRGQNRSGHHHG